MFRVLAQAAADQYGDKTIDHLPNTGTSLVLVVGIGLILLVTGILFIRAGR